VRADKVWKLELELPQRFITERAVCLRPSEKTSAGAGPNTVLADEMSVRTDLPTGDIFVLATSVTYSSGHESCLLTKKSFSLSGCPLSKVTLIRAYSPLNEHGHYHVYVTIGAYRLEDAGAGWVRGFQCHLLLFEDT
jgi:hypothetical protein